MLKTTLKSMQMANQEIERRKIARGHADFMFESHRDICPMCNGKSFQKIKHYEHPCEEGFKLAILSNIAHRNLVKL